MKIRCTHCGNTIEDSLAAGVCPVCGGLISTVSDWRRTLKTIRVTDAPDAGRRMGRDAGQPREMIPLGEQLSQRLADVLLSEQKASVTSGSPVTDPLRHTTAPITESIGERRTDPRWLSPGIVIHNRYEIRETIGSGGFGITYLAWDRQDQTYRAVKEYFQAKLVNRQPGQREVFLAVSGKEKEFEAGKRRILQEARMVARFTSPGIVRVNDYFEENNTAYMVMEYIEGNTLQNYLLDQGRCLEPDEVRRIGIHLCEALEEIHRAGVIHRDIAPDNIFLKEDGSVKIIDFGAARLSQNAPMERHAVLKRGYAPPEQYDSSERGAARQKEWTDIYALGATLYLMLTGRVPVDSKKRFIGREKDPLPEPRTINPKISENLNNTIMKAMAVNIQERFQNAGEMKEALQEYRRVRSLADVRRRQRLVKYALVGGCFAAAAGLVLYAAAHYNLRRLREVLPEAQVNVWYSVPEEAERRQQKNDLMQTLERNLESSEKFAHVDVILTGIPDEEYADRLEEACRDDSMPQLYEMPAEDYSWLRTDADLSDLPELLSENGYTCTLLSENPECLTTGKGAPIGIQIPLMYVNTALANRTWLEEHEAVGSVGELDELVDGDVDVKIAASPGMYDAYEEMLPDFTSYKEALSGRDRTSFVEGDVVVYLGDSSDYYRIRSAVRYSLLPVSESVGSAVCRFDNYWNICTKAGTQDEVTKEVLAYLYSDEMQDLYYLQNTFSGIPLSDDVIGKYPEVQPQFEPLLKDLSVFSFVEEE